MKCTKRESKKQIIFLESYYTEKMPRVMSQFEHLESVRIHMLRVNLKKYVNVLETNPPVVVKECKSLLETIEKVNNEADIENFVKQYKTGEEIPQPFEYEPYVEGSDEKITKKLKNLEQKQKSRFAKMKTDAAMLPAVGGSKPAVVYENPTFGVSLETLMEKQKARFPDLEIPRIIPVLTDSILKLDAIRTEGIFRVPSSAEEVKQMKHEFDEGNYDCVKQFTNVHTPCALLKLWLRDLPTPIIPSNVYDACTETPDKGYELILATSSNLHQKVISYLINYMQKLAVPEISEITKMNKDNLAMVFSPSFLRCPYQDYNKALLASDKEKAFVLYLLNTITPQTINVNLGTSKDSTTAIAGSGGWKSSNVSTDRFKDSIDMPIPTPSPVASRPLPLVIPPSTTSPNTSTPSSPRSGTFTGSGSVINRNGSWIESKVHTGPQSPVSLPGMSNGAIPEKKKLETASAPIPNLIMLQEVGDDLPDNPPEIPPFD